MNKYFFLDKEEQRVTDDHLHYYLDAPSNLASTNCNIRSDVSAEENDQTEEELQPFPISFV